MSAVASEIIDGRGATQNFGENVKCKRTFNVTVTDPTTEVKAIADACGIGFLDVHPSWTNTYCVGIACENDGDPLHYKVTFTYDLLKPEDRNKSPTLRTEKFTFSGGVATAPAVIHYNAGFSLPSPITNSAGDFLPGAEKEVADWKIHITGNKGTFPKALAMSYVNAVNSDAWSGFPPGTLKCQSISGSYEVEDNNGTEEKYWAVSVELAYRPQGWRLQLLDVGYNQLVGGQRVPILDSLKNNISEPAALSGGVAKAAGQAPNIMTFKVYDEKPFNGTFATIPG
jgi:hypothetical protein